MVDKGRIVLSGMEFHAHHGALAEEERLGARFVVDLELELPISGEDRLESTVDYSEVYSLVRRLVTESRHRLIESLAAAIATAVLDQEQLVTGVQVRVHKPHAPLPGVVRDVHVEVGRDRNG